MRQSPHRLKGVHETGQLVEPLGAVELPAVVDDAVQLVDVGQAQLVKVLLTLQPLHGDCWSEERRGVNKPLYLLTQRGVEPVTTQGAFCRFLEGH